MELLWSLGASDPEPGALPGTGCISCCSQPAVFAGGICVLGWPPLPGSSTNLQGLPAFLAPRKLLLWDWYKVNVPQMFPEASVVAFM